jgi:hypothetical protein
MSLLLKLRKVVGRKKKRLVLPRDYGRVIAKNISYTIDASLAAVSTFCGCGHSRAEHTLSIHDSIIHGCRYWCGCPCGQFHEETQPERAKRKLLESAEPKLASTTYTSAVSSSSFWVSASSLSAMGAITLNANDLFGFEEEKPRALTDEDRIQETLKQWSVR